jgi:hypothetical protein
MTSNGSQLTFCPVGQERNLLTRLSMGPLLRSHLYRRVTKGERGKTAGIGKLPVMNLRVGPPTSSNHRRAVKDKKKRTNEQLTVNAPVAPTVGLSSEILALTADTLTASAPAAPTALPVPKVIVAPKHQEGGLCVPYALYNVLSAAERVAWAGGAHKLPETEFLESANSGINPVAHKHKKAGWGHTSEDVRRHFATLKLRNNISEYVFLRRKRTHRGKPQLSLHSLLRDPNKKEGQKILFFGRAPKSDMVDEVHSFLRRARDVDRSRQKPGSTISAEHRLHVDINAFNDKTNQKVFGKKVDACPRHAVTVGYFRFQEVAASCKLPPEFANMDPQHLQDRIMPVLFDPAKKKPKLLTVEGFASSLASIDEVYELSMKL